MGYKYDIADYCVMIVLVSFLGFELENSWLAVMHGYIDNRNMTLPFLLGYGLTVVGFYLIVGTPNHLRISDWFGVDIDRARSYAVYFLLSFAVISLGETLIGTIVEHKFGFEYWNYTFLPLHISKYTSVPTSTGFALILTIFMGYGFEPVMNMISQMPSGVKIAAVILMGFLIIDFVGSFKTMYNNHSLNIRWREELWR